jgi:hypothetical protein
MYQTVDGSNPGRAGPKSAPVAGGTPPRPLDGAWQFWERLRAWDQRFAIVVDTTLALGLFLVCSGWFSFSRVSHPDLWFVAGLTLPLILRRRAPISVFMVIAIVAFAQWSTTAPLVADSSLLVALYTVAAECDWLAVVVAALILEIGVILATERWTPIGNYSKSLIFLTGMAAASSSPVWSCARCAVRSTGWQNAPPASSSSVISRRFSPRPRSGLVSPGRCMTWSRTTFRSW